MKKKKQTIKQMRAELNKYGDLIYIAPKLDGRNLLFFMPIGLYSSITIRIFHTSEHAAIEGCLKIVRDNLK